MNPKPLRSGEGQLTVDDLPLEQCKGRGKLPAGLKMPYPSGPHWGKLKNDALYRKKAIKRLASDDQEEERLLSAMKCYRKQAFKAHGRNAIAEIIKATVSLQASDKRSKELSQVLLDSLVGPEEACRKAAMKVNKKRESVAAFGDPAPKTIVEAL